MLSDLSIPSEFVLRPQRSQIQLSPPSKTVVSRIIAKEPTILLCKFDQIIWPMFEFLLSKGVCFSDIVHMVSKRPKFLSRSLENHIIPSYELLKRIYRSEKETVACLTYSTIFCPSNNMAINVRMLLDEGVAESNIKFLLRVRPSLLNSLDLRESMEEVNKLGFDPSKSRFGGALLAKMTVRKQRWDAKVDTYQSCGWSEEEILEAFRRQPQCMLRSIDKVNQVMRFWVNQLGWNSLMIAKRPQLLGFSLKKRIIPRAMVAQFLLSKGLIKNRSSSLLTPFSLTEQLFLEKYVKCFEQETSELLKLYNNNNKALSH